MSISDKAWSNRIRSRADAIAVHNDMVGSGRFVVWTIYDHPSDYPEQFVVRPHIAVPNYEPIFMVGLGNTLDDVRELLPPGLHRMDRYADDDPNIVEVWV